MPDLSGTDAGVIGGFGGFVLTCVSYAAELSFFLFFSALSFSVSESKPLTVLIPLYSRIDCILSKQIISSVVIFWTKQAHFKKR